MKTIFKQIMLVFLFGLNLLTLLLDWQVIPNVSTSSGMLLITKSVVLSSAIIILYLISIIFFTKAKRVFFVTGLCSLSMLFALEFLKFEQYGYFKHSTYAVYLGLITIIINIVAYILLLRKELRVKNKIQ